MPPETIAGEKTSFYGLALWVFPPAFRKLCLKGIKTDFDGIHPMLEGAYGHLGMVGLVSVLEKGITLSECYLVMRTRDLL